MRQGKSRASGGLFCTSQRLVFCVFGGAKGGAYADQYNGPSSLHARNSPSSTELAAKEGQACGMKRSFSARLCMTTGMRNMEASVTRSAPEGPQGSRRPACCLQPRGDIGCCQLPPRFHHAVALLVPLRACCVKSCRARIDQVDKSPCRLSRRHLTRQPLDGVRTPIGANIGKNGRTLRQQVFKQHDGGVAGVVFGSQDERRPFETEMHTRIYQQHPEVRCIIGACPVYSMAFAVSGAPLDLTLMPESYVQLRELRRISFREGLADPKNIARLLSPEAPALLWENSRLIVVGDSLLQAFDRLEVAEKTAQAIWTAQDIGRAIRLPEKELALL